MIKELKKADWYNRCIKAIILTPRGEEMIERWMEEKLTTKEACRRC